MQIYLTDTLWRRSLVPHRLLNKKFTILLLFLLLFLLPLQSLWAQQDKPVHFGVEKETLGKALDKLAKASGTNIIYPSIEVNKCQNVSVPFAARSIKATLELLLKNTTLDYKFINGRAVIFKKKETPTPESKIEVRGVVTDENSNPLQGITVTINGTQRGTATDKNGRFLLEDVESEATISFQGVGYPKQELQAEVNMRIVLSQQISNLDEVQVIAYGTTTKRLNTGSVATVSAKDIERQPVSNPLAALQGRVPGMTVTQTTGQIGGAFRVEVRGRTAIDRSITDDQPLFVIDGVPYGPNNNYLSTQISAIGNPTNSTSATTPGGVSPMNAINPQDIESITVLKDADATAIYGSRGANGVIMITTKKGKSGRTRINLSGSSGVSSVTKAVKMMNTEQYIAMRRAAFTNDGTTPTASNAYDLLKWDTTRYTDYMKLLTDNPAINTDIQGSVSGGSENTQFLIGAAYNRQTPVFPGKQSYQRGTSHFTINHSSANRRFKINLSGILSLDKNNMLSNDLSFYSYLPPNLIVHDEAGNLAWNEGGVVSFANVLSFLNIVYQSKTKGYAGNMQISYELLDNLTLKLSSGYNTSIINETTRTPSTASNPASTVNNRSTIISDNQINSWILEPQLEYKKQISKGGITVLIGGSFQATNQEAKTINASGFTSDDQMKSIAAATTLTAINTADQYRYSAAFARINYNWQNKYLINVSARRDGSSRFAPENRWATFSSVGSAWVFSSEPFIKNSLSFLSFGKLRASYGVTGNDKITNYQFLDTWTTTFSPYNGVPGLYPNKLYNPTYQWEKTNKLEAALELGLLKDRMLITAAYYQNRSSNQLVRYPLAGITGFTSIIENLPALVQNSGIELTLYTSNVQNKQFNWSASFNITLPKNKLLSYPGLENSSYYSSYVVGQPLNLIYKYKYLSVDPNTGLFTFEDVDKNGTLSVADNQVSGTTDPRFYGGFQNSLQYRSFQFDFFFSFTKQTGKTYLTSLRGAPGTLNNLPAEISGFWQKAGDIANFQKLTVANSAASIAWRQFQNGSNAVYGDASYIRLKNISLSYDLPQQWLRSINFNSAKIFLQGQNLLTITNYKVGDPEIQNLWRTVPMRTVVAGIQVNL